MSYRGPQPARESGGLGVLLLAFSDTRPFLFMEEEEHAMDSQIHVNLTKS